MNKGNKKFLLQNISWMNSLFLDQFTVLITPHILFVSNIIQHHRFSICNNNFGIR